MPSQRRHATTPQKLCLCGAIATSRRPFPAAHALWDLLEHIGRIYADASDAIRRQLIDTFYEYFVVDIDDRVEGEGHRKPRAEDVYQASRAYRTGLATTRENESPRREAEAYSPELPLTAAIAAQGLSNTNLAGVQGFEPRNAGTRTQCLTTWRHPNTATNYTKTGAETPDTG